MGWNNANNGSGTWQNETTGQAGWNTQNGASNWAYQTGGHGKWQTDETNLFGLIWEEATMIWEDLTQTWDDLA